MHTALTSPYTDTRLHSVGAATQAGGLVWAEPDLTLHGLMTENRCEPTIMTMGGDGGLQPWSSGEVETDPSWIATLNENQLDSGPEPSLQRVARDRYQMLCVLGRGDSSEVWRVCDTERKQTVAMKIIKAQLLNNRTCIHRFLLEAQATAQLDHPSIVRVHDVGRLGDGRVFFTMSEVRGYRLTELIQDQHKASGAAHPETEQAPHPLIPTLLAICEAVSHAHQRGVIHRDLKPNNIMVAPGGQVSVLDWGLAKSLGGHTAPVDTAPCPSSRQGPRFVTQVGTVTGTPSYMSPEQARGQIDQHDARTDVYSLGAILYEMLSGRPPYSGSSAQMVINRVIAGPPSPLASGPNRPQALVAICHRALARQPRRRYPCVNALIGELKSWLASAAQA